MFVPGSLISLVTFPGVMVYEFAYMLFCRLFGIKVTSVCYFRFGNPVGFVVHEPPERPSQQIIIGVGPFFLNTVAGFLIALPAVIPFLKYGTATVFSYILFWLGISIAMHSFPSTGDAKNIWKAVWSKGTSVFAKIILTPVAGLIYIFAFGSIVWLDLLYGYIVVMIIPMLI